MRLKALWICGVIGKEFHSLKGVICEAERQAKKVLKCDRVTILDLTSKPAFEGFYVLVSGGSGS